MAMAIESIQSSSRPTMAMEPASDHHFSLHSLSNAFANVSSLLPASTSTSPPQKKMLLDRHQTRECLTARGIRPIGQKGHQAHQILILFIILSLIHSLSLSPLSSSLPSLTHSLNHSLSLSLYRQFFWFASLLSTNVKHSTRQIFLIQSLCI
jgi:hypothetical protein